MIGPDAVMRVGATPGVCSGHARCHVMAPDVFTLDDDGYTDVGAERTVPPGLEHEARRAVAACPELALAVLPEPDPTATQGAR